MYAHMIFDVHIEFNELSSKMPTYEGETDFIVLPELTL